MGACAGCCNISKSLLDCIFTGIESIVCGAVVQSGQWISYNIGESSDDLVLAPVEFL